jgi:hypothetical protein
MLNDGEDQLSNDGAGQAVLTKADLIAEVARITELPRLTVEEVHKRRFRPQWPRSARTAQRSARGRNGQQMCLSYEEIA